MLENYILLDKNNFYQGGNKMVELLTSGALSNRMLLLIFATFFSIFPAMFLIFGIMMRRGQQNNISSYDGEVKGEIIEVLNSEKGAMFATYPIYQYEVNKHKYIVKPNFIFFNSLYFQLIFLISKIFIVSCSHYFCFI